MLLGGKLGQCQNSLTQAVMSNFRPQMLLAGAQSAGLRTLSHAKGCLICH